MSLIRWQPSRQPRTRRLQWPWAAVWAAVAATSPPSAAQPAPAQPPAVRECVQFQVQHGKAQWRNDCGTPVFVIWCGALKYSHKTCGQGPLSGYFTHSTNLPAGQSSTSDVVGPVHYGVCPGSIGFGNDGPYEDLGEGRYRCLPRKGLL